MDLKIFELERYQGLWEQTVEFNLADSGIVPVGLLELRKLAGLEEFEDVGLNYPEVVGLRSLREAIATLHGADPDHVLVTIGASEANAIVAHSLLSPGDHVILPEPCYLQLDGLA